MSNEVRLRHVISLGLPWLITITPVFGQSDPFLKDFEPKSAAVPLFRDTTKTPDTATVTVTINTRDTVGRVSKYLYGNNANTYMGQMVSEPTLINYLDLLSPHILRFPGGNLSSQYFWNALPNQQPVDAPDSLYDENGIMNPAGYWYGKNTASWTLSLDNYYAMLAMTGNTGMITTNYSYARYGMGTDPVTTAAHLAADWVRYDNGRTRFWEIGNENNGSWEAGYQIDTLSNHDGQPRIITGELYGKHFLVFADSMRKAAGEIGATISIGGQLIERDASSDAEPTRSWNSGFFKQAGDAADFFIVHSYYTPYEQNSSASTVLSSAKFNTDAIIDFVRQTVSANHVLMKPLALTEWNIFAVGSKQICSFVNAMHAAIVLGELANDGFSMASRWDLANGYDNGNDHGMFNNRDEPGVPDWNPRPVFFSMYYFQRFFGDHIVSCSVKGRTRIPTVLVYTSTFQSGHLGIAVINTGTSDEVVKLDPGNYIAGDRYYVYSLTGGSDNGEFPQTVYVNGAGPTYATGGPIGVLSSIPAWAYSAQGDIKFASPARSVQFVLINPGEPVNVVESDGSPSVNGFTLCQNYPNPFNPSTTISFTVPSRAFVSVKIFDLLGREMMTLFSGQLSAGVYSRQWDASGLPSGVYFCRLQAGALSQTKKLILLR
jgi:hypothetical protein